FQGDVELVALEVTALSNPVGGLGQYARAQRVEDVLDSLVKALVEQLLRLRTVTGREHAGTGFVDDAQRSGVDELAAEPLDGEPFYVLQGLTGADDDRDARLVEFGQVVERLAGDLVVGAASGSEGL